MPGTLSIPEAPEAPGAPEASGVPEAPKYNNLHLHSIPLLYSLIYNNSISKRVNNYTILLPRHYINNLIDPNKINKFLKV